MKTVLVTAPAEAPITATEFKTHQRISSSSEDTYIDALINAATAYLEEICNRKFVEQTWKLYLDEWPGGAEIELPYGKTSSVTSVVYKDDEGNSTTFSSDSYNVDTDLIPGRIVIAYDESWPSDALFNMNPITITFTCGYGSANEVPEDIKLAIKMLAAHWYENREPVITGTIVANVPVTVDALIWNHRLF